MIEIKIIEEGSVYQVTQILMGWNYSKRTHWYYDLDRKLMSERKEFPDSMLTRPMDIRSWDRLKMWCDNRDIFFPEAE